MPGRSTPAPGGLSRAILEKVRDRDPEALAAFFRTYFDRVYSLAYWLAGTRHAAEDVAQDVFLKVHQAAARLDPDLDPLPWLRRITTNTCRDLWRSGAQRLQRSARSLDEPAADDRIPAPGRDPEAELLAMERERLVQEALQRLPYELRVTVVLHDFDGLKHADVAALLHVSDAAVRKRYSRALSALERLLGEMLR